MKNMTDIVVLLDRSGSMESIRTDTIGGLNAFLQEQQAQPGEARFTLNQFDSLGYDTTVNYQPIKDVKLLTEVDFVPRSATPLLDSMGRMISAVGARLDKTPESDRPDKVVVVIITDGLENASHEFSREQVFAMVKTQQDEFNWLFLYLGANQDGIAVAKGLGIAAQHASSYRPSAKGVASSYVAASASVSQRRSGVARSVVAYTIGQRQAMADGDEDLVKSASVKP